MPTPLKNMSASVGITIPNICSKPPTRSSFIRWIFEEKWAIYVSLILVLRPLCLAASHSMQESTYFLGESLEGWLPPSHW